MGFVLGLVVCLLPACAEGRWVHPTNTEAQAQQDWDLCKSEVLSGQEHDKAMMAGSINLSGCMRSKGYTYVKDQEPSRSNIDAPQPQPRAP
jgi:hypothetical protein